MIPTASSTPSLSLSPSSAPSTSSYPTKSSAPSKSFAPSLPLCKTSTPWAGVLVYYGMTPQCLLTECAGHCRTDIDCAHGLYCHQPDSDFVAGCETIPYPNTNYCVRNELKPSSSPSEPPPSKPSTSPTTLSALTKFPTSKPSTLPTSSSSPSSSPSEEPSISPTVTMVRYFWYSRLSFIRSFVLSYGFNI